MRNLLAFISRYHHLVLFVVLEAISMALLFQYNSYQGSVWFSSANVVAGKVSSWSAEVESYFHLSENNTLLAQRNVTLEQQVGSLTRRLEALTADSSSVRANYLPPTLKQIPAKVVSNEISKVDNLITIDKGSADGVKENMAVVCGNGIVGSVYLVSSHYAVVLPVLNRHSNISCTIQGRGYFGYLHWEKGSPRLAYVDDIPRHARFRLYDKVVTSGYSSLFPPGILVGKILHVYNSPDGLSYRLQVELSTDFSRLRDVCVIDDATMHERLELLRSANDSINTRP